MAEYYVLATVVLIATHTFWLIAPIAARRSFILFIIIKYRSYNAAVTKVIEILLQRALRIFIRRLQK